MKIKYQFFLLQFFALLLAGCLGNSNNRATPIPTTKPSVPSGQGYELAVAVPSAGPPLPVVNNAENNADSANRLLLSKNPIVKILYGFDSIWSLNLDGWQTGDPNKGATTSGMTADGATTDYSNEEIRNTTVWEANMAYVEDVTANRTAEEALQAYYDDRRDKCYSVLDGFGPLMDEYITVSGAYTEIDYTGTSFNVNTEEGYTAEDDEYVGLGDGMGAYTHDLAGLCDLVWLMRQECPASTSGPKYFFSSPRPWRMNSSGKVVYLDQNGDNQITFDDFVSMTDSDGDTKYFPVYESNVSVIPALLINRAKYDTEAYETHFSDPNSNSRKNSVYYGRAKDGGYPSGHTNAAYIAAMGFAYGLPERFNEFLTRASELGENRIVTGMHSPLDIIGGRIQSQAIAAYALNNSSYAERAAAAYTDAGEYFGALADTAGMGLYEYAHYNDTSDWADHDANKELYRSRLTYSLPRTGTSGQAPVIPEGAEALLKTRFPYLSDNQIRGVLYTTVVDSGYLFLDDSNGWGRLDYVTAADGYGAFLGDVTVNMNASAGRFNAHDWWRNDIGGAGLLTKQGSGILTLTGNNSYSGGTLLQEGTLEAESATAFGTGDVYINGGKMLVDADGPLALSGNFTMDNGKLTINMDSDSAQITAAGLVYLESGDLTLDFSDYAITSATDITLVTAGAIRGEFDSVTAVGYTITMKYNDDSIAAHVEAALSN